MKSAAIGVRVHSGWGALVAVAGQHGSEEILERRKVVIIDPKAVGVIQPYHYVEEMELLRRKSTWPGVQQNPGAWPWRLCVRSPLSCVIVVLRWLALPSC